MKKFSNFICNHPKLIVLISFALLFVSIIGSALTKINYDILVYLPKDIETVKGQEILTNDFKMGAYSVAILENMQSKDILDLENKIKNVNGVNEVISIYDAIGTSIPIEILPDNLVSKIHKNNTDLLFITFYDGTSAEETLNAVNDIRKITSNQVKLGGMSSMVLDTMNLSKSEIAIYIIIAVVLCLLVLEFSLDSYLAPVFLLLNIGFAILVNLGTNVFFGSISYITKALVAVLQLGVTTDFSIFLYHSYENKKSEYNNRKEAMSMAIQDTFTSVTGSSLTTIAGFLVLCTMSLTLGRDLGLVMAKGVLLGVISVLTLFPSLLLLFDNILQKTKHKVFIPNFTKLNKFIVKHHIAIFIIFIVLMIPMYLANSKVEVYYKIDRSMPSYLDSKIASTKLKDDFNIVSPEIVLVSNDLKNDDVLKLVNELESIEGIDFALSFSKLKQNGITENMLPEKLSNMVTSDKYQMILVNSLYDIASNELNEQVSVINDIVKKYDENAIVAGEGPLMKDLIKTSDTDFKNVNYASVICIFIILFIVLKSLSLPFLLISSIEFAIFTNMAVAYFDGSVLPFVAPIVLGTIQLGATIDYAILMTTTYLEKRKMGMDKNKAILETLDYSGHSIFISGMCFFAATFGVGLYSKLEMVGYLCTLISRGAIISMLVVITVLPSILLIFDKFIINTTLNTRKVIKMNKNVIKNVSVWIMLLSLIFSSIPVNASAISKNETVYTKLDYSGNVKTVLVNEQIVNASSLDKIEDYTTLEDILNIGNNSTYYKNGNKITWENGRKDILYSGTTTKKLPIDVEVTYKLNGEKLTIDEMLGKSGNVEITLKYINNDKHIVNGNTLYTPFVITTGSIINTEGNRNLDVKNGKVINTGTKNVVVGISSPGLYESLNLKELKDMDTVTISYETEKFELSSIYSVATAKILDNSDLKVFDKLNDLYVKVNTLQDGINKIENGSVSLSNGLNELYTNYNKFNSNLDLVNKNFYTLNNGVQELSTKVNDVLNNEPIKEFREYLPKLENSAEKLKEITNKYSDNIDNINNIINNASNDILNIIDYLEKVNEYLDNTNDYETVINNYKEMISNEIDDIEEFLNNIEKYISVIDGLSSYTLDSSSYIIKLYENNPSIRDEELTKLYNEAKIVEKSNEVINIKNSLNKEKENLSKLKNNLNNTKTKLDSLSKKLLDNDAELVKKIESATKACINLKEIRKNIDNVKDNINNKNDALNKSVKVINELPTKINELETGIDKFESGINEISNGTQKLYEGINTLSEYSNKIYEGIGSLSDGSKELSKGITMFNESGISKINSLVNSNVKKTVSKVKELTKLASNYESFAGKSNIKGETKFIFVIDSKSVPKETNIKKQENTKVSFWERIINLFK